MPATFTSTTEVIERSKTAYIMHKRLFLTPLRKMVFRNHSSSKFSGLRLLDIVLIRHAESTNNVLNYNRSDQNWAMSRESDCGVSQNGKEQIKLLHKYISGGKDIYSPKTTVYSSPMRRCLEKATSFTTLSGDV